MASLFLSFIRWLSSNIKANVETRTTSVGISILEKKTSPTFLEYRNIIGYMPKRNGWITLVFLFSMSTVTLLHPVKSPVGFFNIFRSDHFKMLRKCYLETFFVVVREDVFARCKETFDLRVFFWYEFNYQILCESGE